MVLEPALGRLRQQRCFLRGEGLALNDEEGCARVQAFEGLPQTPSVHVGHEMNPGTLRLGQ